MTLPPEDPPSGPSGPVVTRWTLVVRARGGSPEARAALSDLCAAYYGVVETFIRRETSDPEAARDLTQEFFARVLSGSGLGGADPLRGRFRSYLFGAVKHFLAGERARRLAARRGGGAEHVPLVQDATETQAAMEIADPGAPSPEGAFDRQWAAAVLARALDRLGTEMVAEGRGRLFEVLKPCLQGAAEPPAQAGLAAALGLSEGAVKVAIHRLRQRFRAAVRSEIAETLADPAVGVEEEMRHLVAALRGG